MLENIVKYIGIFVVIIVVAVSILKKRAKQTAYKAEMMKPIVVRKMGFYEKYIKRILDIICASCAIICFSPLYIIIAILVKTKLGSPVLFTQDRPGLIAEDGKENIFKMYKFRTMTNATDKDGNLLPDDIRMTKFGKWLRNTSLDELPEAFNILNGTMSVIGPRPQLVRDLVFMSKEERKRHTVKPGLSGLAQVKGRNAISWEEKFKWDLQYVENISFFQDIRIIMLTIKTAIFKHEGITQDNMETAEDLGVYLLKNGRVTEKDFVVKNKKAQVIIGQQKNIGVVTDRYSVLMSVYANENAEYFEKAINSMVMQTLPPDEIVLVEDGPLNEDLYSVIRRFKVKYPRLITSVVNEKNMGLGIALQKGLIVARNELIARMDTDDIANKERCEKQLNYLNANLDCSIVGGQIAEFIDVPNNIVGKREVPLSDKEIKKFMRRRCPFNHMTVMFRKTEVLKAGNYQDWYWNEDYFLWIRMALENEKFANLADVLVNVRTSRDLYQRRGGIKYFVSERKIQKLMLEEKMIGYFRYSINVIERAILQVFMPNWLRSIVFKCFARKREK